MPARLLLLAALAATVLPPSTAHAQDLADIDGLIARGRFTDARTALVQWREQHPRNSRDASPEQQAFALLLTARLARDAAAAEDAYLALALGYPTSAHAPPALLRLGQGLLAAHEAERARGYLERLVRDYPNAAERAEGMLWLARAQRTTGRATLACATARTARTLRDLHADTALLLQHEERIACARDD